MPNTTSTAPTGLSEDLPTQPPPASYEIPPDNREPPPYDVARIPEHPVTYTFSSLGPTSSSMVLVPPASSPDTRPVYHISVGQDPFFPLCSITSVVRDGLPEGPHVGSFKTIHSATTREAETVCIRQCEHPMNVMWALSKTSTSTARRVFQWYWHNEDRKLEWTCARNYPAASETTCTHPDNPQIILARFLAASLLQRRNRPVDESQLTVTQAGHACLDDILISVLIWERNRRKEFYGIPYRRG